MSNPTGSSGGIKPVLLLRVLLLALPGLSLQACADSSPEIREIRGLPYSRLDVDYKRFEASIPVETSPDAASAPDSFGPACPQNQGNPEWYRDVAASVGSSDAEIPPLDSISEDCLTLNIWAPPGNASPRPVMVWIHGGSNVNGYATEPNYLGEHLAEKGVVVISVQYRLGMLGFLPPPKQDFGNFGLSDLIAALHWIKKNVAGYGGDPDNITLFGESAGGGNIAALMSSPKAKGLFQRAIIQSGTLGPQITIPLKDARDAGAANHHPAERRPGRRPENMGGRQYRDHRTGARPVLAGPHCAPPQGRV